jgi:hypothetical protein
MHPRRHALLHFCPVRFQFAITALPHRTAGRTPARTRTCQRLDARLARFDVRRLAPRAATGRIVLRLARRQGASFGALAREVRGVWAPDAREGPIRTAGAHLRPRSAGRGGRR